jgi:glycogen debranching enzyme
MLDESSREKLELAEQIIRKCVGRNGFYASAQLYRKQYWIRDLAYSLEPLLDLGFVDTVKRQLELTFERQKRSGEAPEMIIERIPSITSQIRLARILLERNPTLLFREIPTSDSDPLALISIERYSGAQPTEGFKKIYVERMKRVWQHIENNLTADGLIPDADWRDAMLNYVGKTSFCNQVLLVAVYRLTGRGEQAESIKRHLNNRFWDDRLGYYQDYPGASQFDSLGHSLALLEDVVPENRVDSVAESLQSASSPFGIRNIWPSYPERECGQSPEYYQNSTVWPFIQGYAVTALVKVGRRDLAEKEFQKMTDLPGFNEWHNPSTGRGGGSKDQLWSAAGYVRACRSLQRKF